ncbi:MAG: hypothetical protein JXD21_05635 [Candidatus Omnitrophica bacterium]|nr:hypothetical protein [Candidatus Omnitrophota bacterium]
MLTKSENNLSFVTSLLLLASTIAYYIFIQFVSPVLYGVDGYYHIAVARCIKDFGLKYGFPWAQFSTFTNAFSDKELLFHLLSVPFLYVTDNIILAAKFSVVFYNLLFFSVFIFILRKYVPYFLIGVSLLFLVASGYFSVRFTCLRPEILAIILTVLGVYFLIKKNRWGVFIIGVVYSLSHISFFTLFIFAVCCETVRYIMKKEVCVPNLYMSFLGILSGSLIHPHNPYNWVSFHLNAILVPFYSMREVALDLGPELLSTDSKKIFIENISLFLCGSGIIGFVLMRTTKLSVDTAVWWACFMFYFFLGFIGSRYWYPATALFIVFAASFVYDWTAGRNIRDITVALRPVVLAVMIFLGLHASYTITKMAEHITFYTFRNDQYEEAASWMKKNLPAQQTVYHANWSVSPYFIALNPKDNYLVVLDPIYMFYPYPEKYMVYKELFHGKAKDPYRAIKDNFGVTYGCVDKNTRLYRQIKGDKDHFLMLHENIRVAVFRLLDNKEQ